MSDDQSMERARSRAESGGDHVVNDVGDADGITIPGAAHELLHESEAEAFLRGIIDLWWLPPLPSCSRWRRDCRGSANDENGVVVVEAGRWEGKAVETGSESVGAEEETAHLGSLVLLQTAQVDKMSGI